jgi:hypothetical protein
MLIKCFLKDYSGRRGGKQGREEGGEKALSLKDQ